MVIEISRKEFISDYGKLSVEEMKNKYELNNGSYYKLVERFNLSAIRKGSKHKTIKVVD